MTGLPRTVLRATGLPWAGNQGWCINCRFLLQIWRLPLGGRTPWIQVVPNNKRRLRFSCRSRPSGKHGESPQRLLPPASKQRPTRGRLQQHQRPSGRHVGRLHRLKQHLAARQMRQRHLGDKPVERHLRKRLLQGKSPSNHAQGRQQTKAPQRHSSLKHADIIQTSAIAGNCFYKLPGCLD